jgi:hypothetical protein
MQSFSGLGTLKEIGLGVDEVVRMGRDLKRDILKHNLLGRMVAYVDTEVSISYYMCIYKHFWLGATCLVSLLYVHLVPSL